MDLTQQLKVFIPNWDYLTGLSESHPSGFLGWKHLSELWELNYEHFEPSLLS